ncbi:MAG: hypothetical protein QXX58_01765 [Thermofilaceae archaeon]
MVEGKTGERVLRWGRLERSEHIHLVIAAAFLMVTGAALLFYRVAELRWIADMLGGIAAVRMLHRVFGALLIAVVVVHLFTRIVVRRLRSKMWPTVKDMRYFFAVAANHLGWTEKLPPKEALGFFDPIAKFNYWVVGVVGLTLQIGTGLVLMEPDWFPWIPASMRGWVLLLHSLGFLFGLIWLTFHVAFSTLFSEYRPLVEAMFGDGTVPLEWVKEHLPGWYEELEKSKA